ncbi:unnamed protein product [Prorocentrum cordatum]|uniref:Protein-serine/threonine kinase n=1 Tax=Prorocentrum cordatum TaxID=2364126 RepID=A0ABN9QNU1_9DINO|nr:unnamed protein product [Polarella glacialis]
MLMEAMHELQEDGCALSHTAVDSWLDRFLLARIGTEMLSTQFLATTSPIGKGIAYRACCPARIVQRAAMRVRSLCAQEFPWLREEDVRIDVESVRHDPDGPGDAHITYVPQYLFYIVVELLKNSARATVLTASDSRRPFERRPITISVCADDKSLVIRVEDRAGGIPAKSLDKVWSYLYTTAPARSDSWEHQGTPLAGFGVGLPLSRLYARYLGGNLRLISMPGQGLESAGDLAHLFCSTDEAEQCGVPTAWAVARDVARVTPWLVPAHGICAEGRFGGAAAAAAPAVSAGAAAGKGRGPTAARRGRPRRCAAVATEAAEREGRVQLAVSAVRVSLEWRPESGLGQGLQEAQAEMLADVSSAAVFRLSNFESGTLRTALRVWGQWAEWAGRQGQPATSLARQPMAVAEFVHKLSIARTSGVRIWNALKWMCVHLKAPFCLDDAFRPVPRDAGSGTVAPPVQATVVEPEMICHVIDFLDGARTPGQVMLAAGMLAVVFAWVRYTHLLRSRPLEKSVYFCWFRASRGKQGKRQGRPSFDWCLPRRLGGARSAADALWDGWHKLAAREDRAGRAVPTGLVFDPVSGAPVKLGAFNRSLKEVFRGSLADDSQLDLVTSYSLRRAGPTWASAIQLDWEARVISGGWTEGGDNSRRNQMPIVYNARRRQAEMCTRLHMAGVLSCLRTDLEAPVQWEQVRCWASSAPGKVTLADLEKEAQQRVAVTTVREKAAFLPPSVVEELRRQKFLRIIVAPRGPAAFQARGVDCAGRAVTVLPGDEAAQGAELGECDVKGSDGAPAHCAPPVRQELAAKYQFDERIATHLVETVGLETLVDFAHAVTSENEWAPILERVPDLERRLGQLSRVRQGSRTDLARGEDSEAAWARLSAAFVEACVQAGGSGPAAAARLAQRRAAQAARQAAREAAAELRRARRGVAAQRLQSALTPGPQEWGLKPPGPGGCEKISTGVSASVPDLCEAVQDSWSSEGRFGAKRDIEQDDPG